MIKNFGRDILCLFSIMGCWDTYCIICAGTTNDQELTLITKNDKVVHNCTEDKRCGGQGTLVAPNGKQMGTAIMMHTDCFKYTLSKYPTLLKFKFLSSFLNVCGTFCKKTIVLDSMAKLTGENQFSCVEPGHWSLKKIENSVEKKEYVDEVLRQLNIKYC